MKNRILPLIFGAILTVNFGFAQKCGTYEGSYEEQKQKYPAFYQNLESLNAELAADYKSTLSKMTHLKVENGKKIIPVVVHVIYDGNLGIIADADIQGAIDALNQNINGQSDKLLEMQGQFIKTPDIFASVRGVANVEFRLARIDPLGNPTSGIVRVRSELTNLSEPHDQVKALSYWSSYQYFNIWTVQSFTQVGLLGYAQFPFTNVDDWEDAGFPAMSTDGVVLLRSSMEVATNTTLTHETGHWLGLRHTWGDAPCGNDGIYDTPTQRYDNNGASSSSPTPDPPYPKGSPSTFPYHVGLSPPTGVIGLWGCVADSLNPAGEMFMNYMSYTVDPYHTMFTAGQVDMMNETLDGKYDSETNETGIGFREYMWATENIDSTGVADGHLTPICTQKADFEITTGISSICQGASIMIKGNKTQFGNGDVTAMIWDFGDGNTNNSNANQVLHDYEAEGLFNVSLTLEYKETTEARATSLSDLDAINSDSINSDGKTIIVQGTESELIAMGATNILLHLDIDSLSINSIWKHRAPEDSVVGAHSSFLLGLDTFQLVFSAKPLDSLEIEDYERLALCFKTWEVDSIDYNTGDPLIFYYGEYESIAFKAYFMDTLFYRGNLEQKTYTAYYTNTCTSTVVKENFISVAPISSSSNIGSSITYDFEDAANLSSDVADVSSDWHITTNVVDGDWGFNARQNSSWEWIDGVARSGDASIIFNKDNLTPRIGFGQDELISKAYDLSTLSNPVIKFSWSGAAVNTFFDNELIVSYSTTCGEEWNELGRLNSYTGKYGRRANGDIVALGQAGVVDTVKLIGAANAGLYTTNFKPEANEWNDTIMFDRDTLLRHDNIRFKFDYITSTLLDDRPHGSANNFYIDNIQIGESSVLFSPEVNASKLYIYPNPTNGQAVIRLENLADMNVEVKLVNLLGAEVRNLFEGEIVSNYYVLDKIDLSALKTGIYFVKVVANGNIVTTDKLILSK